MMERFISASLWLVLVLNLIYRVTGNAEGDALTAWKIHLADPYNVLLSWVPRTDPCGWYNITCSGGKSVTKVELVNASLSGSLVPEMGQLWNLEHLELTANNISGIIPEELGNLTNLLSLNLSSNALTGRIPATLGKLTKLSSLRLNNNSLSGTIPMSLTTLTALQVLDLSDNQLVGDVPVNGSFSVFTPVSFANNRFNNILIQPTKPSAGNSATAAIAGGVAAASALLFAATAIVLV